ncbi:MAG: hypothetical protein EPO32_01425 [Anaerolineae bacterium]|nr:MAG: hypothetical protein EPO32_01425 [Anaerolineae bacterium]
MNTLRTLCLVLALGLGSCVAPVAVEPDTQAVTLYFYNPANDVDDSGNILCSPAGLVAVLRQVDAALKGEALIQATLDLLLAGELTAEEVEQGVTTEFPLDGVTLESVAMEGSTLSLTFNDPNFQTSGGACRAGILWAQVEATARQFPGVPDIRVQPDEAFQP